MADISEGQIRESIAEILKHGDLTTLTSKSVRKMLENKFEVELTERKKEIDNMLMAMIEAKQEEENGQHSDSDSSDDSVRLFTSWSDCLHPHQLHCKQLNCPFHLYSDHSPL
ncbi:Hypp1999 [Branchiostoma lanceolatum]|uniref:Hypp1999 protein n=1 Tax=Branchiostoma lanceolatum TaxID=7740 RepID=A0A8K0EQZ3_BRALA|nr:Hypp1999 [Branchiostoma lanceolatum]